MKRLAMISATTLMAALVCLAAARAATTYNDAVSAIRTAPTYPGIAARAEGFLPVGMCLIGSGDPYFLKTGSGDDPPLVRIPHQAVGTDDHLDVDSIEQVAPRLSDFLQKAQVG